MVQKSNLGGNGSQRIRPAMTPAAKSARVEDFKDLSDKELIAVANGSHEQFCGSLRKAIVVHARLAGAALLQLKSRHQSGWRDWLKDNFKGSEETARLYMRIARNWGLIVEQGLDREGATLDKLRWVLSDSLGRVEPDKKAKAGKAKGELKLESEDGGTTDVGSGDGSAGRSKTRQVPLLFSEDDVEEFEEQVRRLGVAYKTDNPTDTVREAVRRQYEEVTRG